MFFFFFYEIQTKDVAKSRVRGKSSAEAMARCTLCHRLRSRTTSVLARLCSKQEWGEIGHEKKGAFMDAAAHLFGDKLQKLVQTTLDEHRLYKATTNFNALGSFKDEIDLTEKYKNKPEQLKNIMEHAAKYFCPVRRVTLFADPEYSLLQSDLVEQTKKSGRHVEEEDKVRPAKKAKTKSKARAVEEAEADGEVAAAVPTINKGQLNRLAKLVDKIKTAFEGLAGPEQAVTEEKLELLLPPFILPKCEKIKALAMSTIASLEMAIESKKGIFDTLFNDADDCFKKTKSTTESLSNALGEARDFAREQAE